MKNRNLLAELKQGIERLRVKPQAILTPSIPGENAHVDRGIPVDPDARTLPIVCISLSSDQLRRDLMQKQFASNSLTYRFFDAVCVDAWPSNYRPRQRLRVFGKHLSLGEIGCYQSHRTVWRQLVESSDQAWCILEDDVEILPNFRLHLDVLMSHAERWDIVRLRQVLPRKGGHVVQSFGGVQLLDFPKHCCGTDGYVITRRAAAELLRHTHTMLRPIDDTIDRVWEHRLRLYCLAQAAIGSADLPSTITDRIDRKRHPYQKIIYEAYALRDLVFRGLHNLERRRGLR